MAQPRQRGSSAGRGHGLGQADPDTPPGSRRLQAPSLSADPLNRHPSSAGSAPPHSEQAVPTALAARTAGPPRLTPSSIPRQAGIRPTPKLVSGQRGLAGLPLGTRRQPFWPAFHLAPREGPGIPGRGRGGQADMARRPRATGQALGPQSRTPRSTRSPGSWRGRRDPPLEYRGSPALPHLELRFMGSGTGDHKVLWFKRPRVWSVVKLPPNTGH